MEQQPVYASDLDDDYDRWLAGTPTDPATWAGFDAWLSWVAGLVESGRRMVRVRVHDDPPSDYQRFARWVGQWNVQAGEEIHYLDREQAAGIMSDRDDWWLLDEERLLVMQFDAAGELESRALVTDKDAVLRARTVRDQALAAVAS